MKRKIYFAHPINTYNTILETYFLDYFKQWENDIEIINPNQEIHQIGYQEKGMDYFKDLVLSCDSVYTFGFGDNTIGAGIAKEMNWMFEKGGKVVFLPFFTNWVQMETDCMHQFKVLTVEETRIKLKNK